MTIGAIFRAGTGLRLVGSEVLEPDAVGFGVVIRIDSLSGLVKPY